jgi:hypothetical protein
MRAGTGQDVSDSDAVGAPATYLDRGRTGLSYHARPGLSRIRRRRV